MNRTLAGPALLVAALLLAAAALSVLAPTPGWGALGASFLLGSAPIAGDIARRRRSGLGSVPSSGAHLLAASVLFACALVAASGVEHFGAMIPILGAGAIVPLLARPPRPCAGRRAS